MEVGLVGEAAKASASLIRTIAKTAFEGARALNRKAGLVATVM